MQLIKPIARAISGTLNIVAAFYGVLMTSDLFLIFGVIAATGLINLVVGIFSDKEASEDRKQAAEDRQILRQVQKHMEANLPASKIPLHLRNMSKVSDAELKQLVGRFNSKLRKFAPFKHSPPHWETIEHFDLMSEEMKTHAFRKHSEQKQVEFLDRENDFRAKMQPDAVALWEELIKRVPREYRPEEQPIAIKYGSLAGVRSAEEAAIALEAMARHIGEQHD